MFDNDILASRLYAICLAISKMMYLTILFIIFSLPLITVGASLTALIATIRQPEYKIFKIFWNNFRRNFLRSLIVLIFTGFTIMFLVQVWDFIGNMPAGNIIYFFIFIFLVVYNLNAYLLVSILEKYNITFFRQVFFFTLGTFYKTFFIPLIAAGLAVVSPIVGGTPLLFMSISIVLTIYVKMLNKDLKIVKDYL